MKTQLTTFGILLTLVLAASGAWGQGQGMPPPSGFLADYTRLQPATDREGSWIYMKKGDFRSYTKVYIAPIEVWVSPSSQYKGIQPDVLKTVTDNFRNALTKALEPDYHVVDQPGPGVLRLRGAVTGVSPVKPPLTPVDILPIKALFNVARSASGHEPRVVEISAEFEIADPDNQVVLAGVATRKGDKTLDQGAQITPEQMAAISDYWAKGVRLRLDQLRGVAPRP